MNDEIIVVGGGIWGLSTAYHLAERGAASVTVLERNAEVAMETTPRAAGLIGQIRSSPTMCRAIRYALDLLSDFEQKSGLETGLRRPGSLMVALTPQRMQAYRDLHEHAAKTGVESSFVSRTEMMQMCPAMNVEALEGGLFVPGDGYVDAGQCAQAFAQAARDHGVRIECGVAVAGLDVENGVVRGVDTDRGRRSADRIVVTAGPWTAALAHRAGGDLPLQTIRHQRARTVAVDGIPQDHPVVRVTDVSCYLRPDRGGYLFGFFEPEPHLIDFDELPDDFRTDDVAEPKETIAEAVRRLGPVFPDLMELPIAEYRQGITSFAPDGAYLLGPVPGCDGLFAASACAAIGIAGSAAIGRWLASWVVDGDPGEDLAEFGLQRFGSAAADGDWVRRSGSEFYANYYSIQSMGITDE